MSDPTTPTHTLNNPTAPHAQLHAEERDYIGYLETTITANVEIRVRATSPEDAKASINQQMQHRFSNATDALAEYYSEVIRKEPIEYQLEVGLDTDAQPDRCDDQDN